MKCLFVLSLCFLVSFATQKVLVQKDYKGAQVLRALPETNGQVYYLRGLQLQDKYDFWTEPRQVGEMNKRIWTENLQERGFWHSISLRFWESYYSPFDSSGHPVDIMAKRWMVPVLKAALDSAKIKYSAMYTDVELAVKSHFAENERALALTRNKNTKHNMDWSAYHDYIDIEGYLTYLGATYPSICSLIDIGATYEGRRMWMIKISTGGSGKPAIFIDGGIHAREWISPAVVTYFLLELVENSAAYQDILNLVDFYVLPDINPDGYSHSWTNDRLWRKTRSDHNSAVGCMGVDGNRNWDIAFGGAGTSPDKCSDIYMGPNAFSEIEMANVRDQMVAYQADIKVYLSFHSYSQYWLYGWAYDAILVPDWQDLDALAASACTALEAVYGTPYIYGCSGIIFYPTGGSSDDYAKGVANIKYSYTVELRDTGTWGFLLPPAQILPTSIETFEALKVVANFIKDTYGKK